MPIKNIKKIKKSSFSKGRVTISSHDEESAFSQIRYTSDTFEFSSSDPFSSIFINFNSLSGKAVNDQEDIDKLLQLIQQMEPNIELKI